ncbi:histidine--tRNA ligase [Candidatus Cyanaurora vandensis]|uniref:histidine--tRNA ligase n=3 Tax=Candidatus Cyanaurora vandensis TaxID=2714958 RepID=UPI00257A7280|nr:histidine--tRNA ligase [Candidatus Cyanaurora vandensis]
MAELDTPSGMRDFLPEVMQLREYAIETIKGVFRQWGFLPLETPAMERWETLAGKYGEEGEKLIYHGFNSGNLGDEPLYFSRKERPELALRYDLTVPLARVMAMYGHKLAKPFKRYQVQPVWRGDRPGAGRFREFVQCDVDVIGSTSLLVEAELIAATHEILTRLGFPDFKIRLNHRQVLRGMIETVGLDPSQESTVLTAIDKLDKLPPEKVRRELEAKGIPTAAAQELLRIVTLHPAHPDWPNFVTQLSQSPSGQHGLAQLTEILALLQAYGLPAAHYALDLSLARGLDYYTGAIFETIIPTAQVGSVGGGGRYDGLISTLSGGRVDLPAAGTSLGLDRLLTAMENLGLTTAKTQSQKILVTHFSEPTLRALSLRFTRELRQAGLAVEIYYGDNPFSPNELRRQLSYAEKKAMTHALIIAPDEATQGQVALKNLTQRQQLTLTFDQVVPHLV